MSAFPVAGATMTFEEDLTYSFEMYHPQTHAVLPEVTAELAGGPTLGAQGAVPDSGPEEPLSATSSSPFDSQSQLQCNDPTCCGVLDEHTGMFACDYAVPTSPFASCPTGPAQSAFGDWQSTCGKLGSLKTALPSHDLSSHDSLEPGFRSHSPAMAISSA